MSDQLFNIFLALNQEWWNILLLNHEWWNISYKLIILSRNTFHELLKKRAMWRIALL